jgi:hypothetical protein
MLLKTGSKENTGILTKKWLKIKKIVFCNLIIEFFPQNQSEVSLSLSYKITGL